MTKKGTEAAEGVGAHRSWADLPEEILTLIAERLNSRVDFLRFCATCSSWRASTRTLLDSTFNGPLKVPKLFVSQEDQQKIQRTFHPIEGYGRPALMVHMYTVYLLRMEKTCWLAYLREKPYNVGDKDKKMDVEFLFKTLSGDWSEAIPKESNIMDLSMSELCKYYIPVGGEWFPRQYVHGLNVQAVTIEKLAVIFSSSVAGEYAAVGICGDDGKLAFLKSSKDGVWTSIDDYQTGYNDVIDYNDKFYAIHYTGKLLQIDLSSKVTEISSPINNNDESRGTASGTQKIFVRSTGDLLVLNKYVEVSNSLWIEAKLESLWFKVYKLNEERETHKLVEIQSLGDRALFLPSEYCSYSVSAPHLLGCKPNCIYFIEQCDNAYHMDWFSFRRVLRLHFTAVFDLEDGTYTRVQLHRVQLSMPVEAYTRNQCSAIDRFFSAIRRLIVVRKKQIKNIIIFCYKH